jgi:membrane-associated phospholipid phosphatase
MRFLHILLITITILLGLSNRSLLAQNEGLETAGDIILFALPAAVLTTTFIKGDTKGSWQFAKGFLLTEAVTFGLKVVIVKNRPDSSGKDSFPSGHTSTTFHSAAFVHRRYGFKYSIPAYALAGFTAASRIAADKHDGWDVLGGMIIGVGSAYLFTTEYQKEHMELTFTKHRGSYLLGFNYKF